MDDVLYKELTNSLKSVFDVTSRIDERIKILIEDNNNFKNKFDKVTETQNTLLSRVVLLEEDHDVKNLENDILILQKKVEYLSDKTARIEQELNIMEKSIAQHDNRWSNILDFAYKVATIVVGAIILWKLGIKP